MNIFGRKVNLLAVFVTLVAVCVLFVLYYKQSGWVDTSSSSSVGNSPRSAPRVLKQVDLKLVDKSTFRSRKSNIVDKESHSHSQTSSSRKKTVFARSRSTTASPPRVLMNKSAFRKNNIVDKQRKETHSHSQTSSSRNKTGFASSSTIKDAFRMNMKPVKQRGYVITQTYNGQMTRAIRNMMGQQCWAWSLGDERGTVSVVEPFSSESKLVHFKRFWDAFDRNELYDAVRFSDYFNIEHYNKLSIESKNSPITLWEDFLADSQVPRYFVAVVLPSGRCTLTQSRPVNLSRVPEISTSCFYTKPFSELIQGLLQRFNGSIVKKVCIDCSKLKYRLTLEELNEIIYGNGDSSQYTVLMSTWRNFAFTQKWLEIPSYCKTEESPKSSNRLVPSKSVAAHSKIYRNKVIKSDRVIAMMFRIERFLTLKVLGRSNETLTSCIKKSVDIRNKLSQEKFKSQSSTFLTLDIGRFGSKIMQKNMTVAKYGQDSLESINKTVHDAFDSIYNGQFKSIEEWENSFIEAAGGITERGYISLVQRSIATEADCLILMGGGSYQQVALEQYLINHPEKATQCVHTVCIHDSFQRLLPSD